MRRESTEQTEIMERMEIFTFRRSLSTRHASMALGRRTDRRINGYPNIAHLKSRDHCAMIAAEKLIA